MKVRELLELLQRESPDDRVMADSEGRIYVVGSGHPERIKEHYPPVELAYQRLVCDGREVARLDPPIL